MKIKSAFTVLFFISIVVYFFRDLFYPSLSLYYPADFLLSDLVNVTLSLKYALSESLTKNQLPFMTDLVGNGFPLIAESQIGAFSLINILLYKFLPFVWAFNLSYPLFYFCLLASSYLLSRQLGSSRLLAILFSITFSFSSAVYLKIVHQDLLKAIAFIPLLFYLTIRAVKERSLPLTALAAFVASQQFLFGHFYFSIISNFFLVLWLVGNYFLTRNRFLIRFFILYLTLFLLIASPQIIQTAFFFLRSTRLAAAGSNLIYLVFEFPFLLTFFYPFPFGQIRNGEIFKSNIWYQTKMVPWEGNLFTGFITPFLLIVVFLFLLKGKRIKFWSGLSDNYRLFFILFITSFFLMFGGQTPLRLVFSLPILNGLRALSRFSVFTVFFGLLTFFCWFRQLKLNNKQLLILILVQLFTFNYFYSNYYPVVNPQAVFNPPPVIKFLKEKQATSYEYGTRLNWRNTFYQSGYLPVKKYLNFHNANWPYLNLIYHSPTGAIFINSGFNDQHYYQLIDELELSLMKDAPKHRLSEKSKKLLNFFGTTHLISTTQFNNLPLVYQYQKHYVYQITKENNIAKFYTAAQSYFSDQQFINLTSTNKFSDTTLYLKNRSALFQEHKTQIKTTKLDNGTYRLKVSTDKPGYLYLRLYRFFGYQAYLDGQKTPILEANSVFMALHIPKGSHQVYLRYCPPYGRITLFLSLVGYAAIIIICLRGKFGPNKDISSGL